jgi:hypothetical protein
MAYNHDLDHNNDGMNGFYVYEIEENKYKNEVIDAIDNVEKSLIELARRIVKLEDKSKEQFKQLQRAFSMSNFPMDIYDLRHIFKNTKLTFKKNNSTKELYKPVFSDPLDLLCDNKTIFKSNFDKVIDTKEVKVYMTKSLFSHNDLDYKVVFHIYLKEKFDYKDGYIEMSIIPANISREHQIKLIKKGKYFVQFKETRIKEGSFDNQRRTRLKEAYQIITKEPLPVSAINYLRQYN